MGDVRGVTTAAGANFGGTGRAGTIPDSPAPSEGPVYLEGRLVLSLSFADGSAFSAPGDEEPIEHLCLWDDDSEGWHDCGLEVLRYEDVDVVLRDGAPVWSGVVHTHAPVILVPDLDDEGFEANLARDLRWRRYGN